MDECDDKKEYFAHNCNYCGYSTNKKSSFDNHNKSQKHKCNVMLHNYTIKTDETDEIFICNNCGKVFKTNSGCLKHERKCKFTDLSFKEDIYKYVKSKLDASKSKVLNSEMLCAEVLNNSNYLEYPNLEESKFEKSNDLEVSTNYIYLLQEREFIKCNEQIYKIGMTKKENHTRFSKYPKGSVLLFQMICKNCEKVERNIIKLFQSVFLQRKDIGTEYFEGKYINMIKLAYAVILEDENQKPA
jgi:hypothetical protein